MRKESPKRRALNPQLVGLCLLGALLPFYAIFVHFGKENIGFILLCISGIFLTVIYVNRSSLNVKFFAEVFVLYTIHVVFIFLTPIPDKIPGAAMIPISLADLLLVIWVLRLLGNFKDTTAD